MDPEENYRQQKRLHGSKDPSDKARLRELVAALRGWVAAGGFRPSGFVGPAWKPATATGGKPVRCAECGRKLDKPEPHLRPRTTRQCRMPDYVNAKTGKAWPR
jgi:hypothetical protein